MQWTLQETKYMIILLKHSLNRIANDAADVLINTPGSPENWEEIKYGTRITPGLAKYEIGKKGLLVIH